ncbi:unnamed protein product, partial [Iphiclides podalirius]
MPSTRASRCVLKRFRSFWAYAGYRAERALEARAFVPLGCQFEPSGRLKRTSSWKTQPRQVYSLRRTL